MKKLLYCAFLAMAAPIFAMQPGSPQARRAKAFAAARQVEPMSIAEPYPMPAGLKIEADMLLHALSNPKELFRQADAQLNELKYLQSQYLLTPTPELAGQVEEAMKKYQILFQLLGYARPQASLQ